MNRRLTLVGVATLLVAGAHLAHPPANGAQIDHIPKCTHTMCNTERDCRFGLSVNCRLSETKACEWSHCG